MVGRENRRQEDFKIGKMGEKISDRCKGGERSDWRRERRCKGSKGRDRRLRRCRDGLKVKEVIEGCKDEGRWKSIADEINGRVEGDAGRGMREEWEGVEKTGPKEEGEMWKVVKNASR